MLHLDDVNASSRPRREAVLLLVVWGALALGALTLVFALRGLRGVAVAVVTLVVGSVVTGAVQRARGRRLARTDRVEVALRVVEGAQPGLGRRWRHGTAALAPGRLVFRPTVGGIRFLRRAPVEIDVLAVEQDPDRVTGLREAWEVLPGLQVLTLRTATSRLDCAVPTGPEQVVGAMMPPTTTD